MHCLCCSGSLLRHIGEDGLYWYCLHCHQVMPNHQAIASDQKILDRKRDRPSKRVNLESSHLPTLKAKLQRPTLWLIIPVHPNCV